MVSVGGVLRYIVPDLVKTLITRAARAWASHLGRDFMSHAIDSSRMVDELQTEDCD